MGTTSSGNMQATAFDSLKRHDKTDWTKNHECPDLGGASGKFCVLSGEVAQCCSEDLLGCPESPGPTGTTHGATPGFHTVYLSTSRAPHKKRYPRNPEQRTAGGVAGCASAGDRMGRSTALRSSLLRTRPARAASFAAASTALAAASFLWLCSASALSFFSCNSHRTSTLLAVLSSPSHMGMARTLQA